MVANSTVNRERRLVGVNSYERELGFDPVTRAGEAWLDLVDHFDHFDPGSGVELLVGSVHDHEPSASFDLITCIHGLHYVGDKLGALTRASTWLRPGGLLVATLDLATLVTADGAPLGRPLLTALRSAGFAWDARRHLISVEAGVAAGTLDFDYLGASDAVGASWTGQPAVHSAYAPR